MFEKIRNLDRRSKNILETILIIVFSVGFLVFNLISDAIEAKKEQEESMKTAIVVDHSRYMTVLGCARKFVKAIQDGDKDNLMILIEKEYREKSGLNISNISNFLPTLDKDGVYDYEGGLMYEHRLSKNVVEYYLEGNIQKSIMDEASTSIKYDMTITLYESEFTFSIRSGIGDLNYEE